MKRKSLQVLRSIFYFEITSVKVVPCSKEVLKLKELLSLLILSDVQSQQMCDLLKELSKDKIKADEWSLPYGAVH